MDSKSGLHKRAYPLTTGPSTFKALSISIHLQHAIYLQFSSLRTILFIIQCNPLSTFLLRSLLSTNPHPRITTLCPHNASIHFQRSYPLSAGLSNFNIPFTDPACFQRTFVFESPTFQQSTPLTIDPLLTDLLFAQLYTFFCPTHLLLAYQISTDAQIHLSSFHTKRRSTNQEQSFQINM